MQKGEIQPHDFIGLTANFPGYNLPLGSVAEKASPLTSLLLRASRGAMVSIDRREGDDSTLHTLLQF